MATPRKAELELDAYIDRIASLKEVIVQSNEQLGIPVDELIVRAVRKISSDLNSVVFSWPHKD